MKKLTLIFVTFLTVSAVFGQKPLRLDAYNFLRKGQLDKAMTNIEPTISDPTTMSDPKTWFYRGNIYLQIHMSDNPAYKSLDPDALSKAYESYKKLLELDTKKEYYTEAIQNIFVISEQLYNQGVNHFKDGDSLNTNADLAKANANLVKAKADSTTAVAAFSKALVSFERAVDVNATYGNVDTLAIFNAGLSADKANNYAKAKQYYGKVIEMNYPQPLVYNSLSDVYLEEKDTLQAVATIQEGRKKYPDNFTLLIAETNIYLAAKQNDKAMANLKEAVKTDPMNPTIHYAVGVNYFSMNNLEEAEKSYLKAIEIKPDYFEANYNLGALYVNQAATLIDKANKLPLSATAEYDALKLQADDVLKKSIPFLETASRLDPSDKGTLLSLKEIYTRLNMLDKRKEVEAKLAGL
ncbi:MAG: tetratricopeptide repeat protein [Bacteroidales bacterium]|nr:tetratricopeptide repeat protein [Bacteroidales bacterium]